MTILEEIEIHSESVTLCIGKFLQNFSPPGGVRNIFGIIIVTPVLRQSSVYAPIYPLVIIDASLGEVVLVSLTIFF